MYAIAMDDFGGRDQLKGREMPDPAAGPGEVVIRIRAAGVNPVDCKIRKGLLQTRLPHQFPIIPGWDAAGEILETGEGACRFRPGDRVYAYCRKPVVQWGAYAERIALPESSVARMPEGVAFEAAAALPLAALTAWQSLFDAANLQRGQTVLIHAGAGGVGHFAVQLAREQGARVLSTAGPSNLDFVRSLGADEVIDYRAGDFREAVRRAAPDGVDVAFDTVGAAVQQASADVVRRGGVLVSILAFDDEASITARGIRPAYVFVRPDRVQLECLTERVESGRLIPHLERIYPLGAAAEAHDRIESGHVRGKLVLSV